MPSGILLLRIFVYWCISTLTEYSISEWNTPIYEYTHKQLYQNPKDDFATQN